MDVNYFDIAIVVIILITALIGFMRGIVWMAVFLTTWVAAILLAIKYKDILAAELPIKLDNELIQTGVAALVIFLGVLTIGAIINYLFNKMINAIGLGSFDRILGTGLGIVLGSLAVTLLVMLTSLTELPEQEMWGKSKFIPKFQEVAVWMKTKIPDDLNEYIDQNLSSPTPAGNQENESTTPPVEPATTAS